MILLVDSNELLLETMQDYLASLGHECIATRDAVEAAEILAGEANINLLVCEQILSHHSGIELIQQAAQSRPAMKN
ncbi:MAG TPA: hypothetical protein DIW28_05300, partial [Zetaproteobacteria bacterium]|nr:hypothetical protein [Zetaproteobacteria bacterium]